MFRYRYIVPGCGYVLGGACALFNALGVPSASLYFYFVNKNWGKEGRNLRDVAVAALEVEEVLV